MSEKLQRRLAGATDSELSDAAALAAEWAFGTDKMLIVLHDAEKGWKTLAVPNYVMRQFILGGTSEDTGLNAEDAVKEHGKDFEKNFETLMKEVTAQLAFVRDCGKDIRAKRVFAKTFRERAVRARNPERMSES